MSEMIVDGLPYIVGYILGSYTIRYFLNKIKVGQDNE